MKNEKFKTLVIENWNKYNPTDGNSTMFQFVESLKKVKKVIGEWAKLNFQNSQWIKAQIAQLFNLNNSGIFSEEEKRMQKALEEKKTKFLEWEEAKRRMKRIATWLTEGR
jgi:hypothetical protein